MLIVILISIQFKVLYWHDFFVYNIAKSYRKQAITSQKILFDSNEQHFQLVYYNTLQSNEIYV